MSRCIDADALEELFREVIGGIAKKPEMNGNLEHMVRASAMVIEMIQDAPTIEPRCETCEAFNKTRLLIPQPQRKKGMWIDSHTTCSECGWQMIDDVIESPNIVAFNFCPNCGAEMRTPVETARDIVHEAINNSVWSDAVDTAKMHKVVDDKYAEMTKKTEESKRCDTCKHEKARWYSKCADCSDYELWEKKDD